MLHLNLKFVKHCEIDLPLQNTSGYGNFCSIIVVLLLLPSALLASALLRLGTLLSTLRMHNILDRAHNVYKTFMTQNYNFFHLQESLNKN